MALSRRDERYHTYADYLSWPDDVRYELVDGTAYLMSPAPDLVHQSFVGEIFFQYTIACFRDEASKLRRRRCVT